MTTPDMKDKIKYKLIRLLDGFYAICESLSSKLNVWSWHKRWNNRETGTGYKGKK